MIDFNSLVFNSDGFAEITPSIIPNTTMLAKCNATNDGIQLFRITPIDGYVMHNKSRDFWAEDPTTGEYTLRKLGFSAAMASCGGNYDFTPCTVTDYDGTTYTGYGTFKEFFAIPRSSVPENQIFGVKNNHEVM